MCLQLSGGQDTILRAGNGPTGLLPILRLEFEQEPVSTVLSQGHYRLHSLDRSKLLCMQRPATKCACLSGLRGWGRHKVPRNSLGHVLLEMQRLVLHHSFPSLPTLLRNPPRPCGKGGLPICLFLRPRPVVTRSLNAEARHPAQKNLNAVLAHYSPH